MRLARLDVDSWGFIGSFFENGLYLQGSMEQAHIEVVGREDAGFYDVFLKISALGGMVLYDMEKASWEQMDGGARVWVHTRREGLVTHVCTHAAGTLGGFVSMHHVYDTLYGGTAVLGRVGETDFQPSWGDSVQNCDPGRVRDILETAA